MMDQPLIETSTALACVIVASVFFALGVWMGCSIGRSRTLEAVWNKWNRLTAEEARRIECERLHSDFYKTRDNGDAYCLMCGRKWHVEKLSSGFPMVPIDTLLNDPR